MYKICLSCHLCNVHEAQVGRGGGGEEDTITFSIFIKKKNCRLECFDLVSGENWCQKI